MRRKKRYIELKLLEIRFIYWLSGVSVQSLTFLLCRTASFVDSNRYFSLLDILLITMNPLLCFSCLCQDKHSIVAFTLTLRNRTIRSIYTRGGVRWQYCTRREADSNFFVNWEEYDQTIIFQLILEENWNTNITYRCCTDLNDKTCLGCRWRIITGCHIIC